GLGGLILLATGLVMLSIRYAETRWVVVIAVIASAALIGLVSRIISPVIVGPGLAAITVLTFAFHPALGRSVWLWIIVACSVIAPWALELSGLLQPTLSTRAGDIVISSPSVFAHSPQIEIGLVVYAVMTVAVAGMFGRALAISTWNMRCKLQLQAWHLRQIVPT